LEVDRGGTAAAATAAVAVADRPRGRSPTTLELDACCRRNMVSDRTRFFEEKSRRAGAWAAGAAVPARRRSRSAAPRLSRADTSHPAATATHVVPSSAVVGQPAAPASTPTATELIPAVNGSIAVNNATGELQVDTSTTRYDTRCYLTCAQKPT